MPRRDHQDGEALICGAMGVSEHSSAVEGPALPSCPNSRSRMGGGGAGRRRYPGATRPRSERGAAACVRWYGGRSVAYINPYISLDCNGQDCRVGRHLCVVLNRTRFLMLQYDLRLISDLKSGLSKLKVVGKEWIAYPRSQAPNSMAVGRILALCRRDITT